MNATRDSETLYSITELSQELGLTPRAIRFYETKGLLKPQRVGTTRAYGHRDRARLQIIQRGKRMGFSLSEIKEYLDLRDADPAHHQQLTRLLQAVRERKASLEKQHEDLELTLEELRVAERQCLEAMAESSSPSQIDSQADGGCQTP